jgi:hypothetical protein
MAGFSYVVETRLFDHEGMNNERRPQVASTILESFERSSN